MQIDQDLTKCLVITNYRTGSTSFCIKNSQKNKLNNLWEILNKEDKFRDIHKVSDVLRVKNRFIAKVMPDQFDYNYDKLKLLTQYCDQIVYLYRKDFKAQCLSWIAMQNLQDWHNRDPSHTVKHVVDIDQAFADKHSKVIRDNNDFLKECIKKHPAPVFAYEDIQDNKPYKREYEWKYMPYISTYDTTDIHSNQDAK